MNRRIDVVVVLSRKDRDVSEGLCGNWNGNRIDDLTGRDGSVASSLGSSFDPYGFGPYSVYEFVRSWR
jgi:hypothetical protein